MANVPESSTWESGVYQLETTDPVLGGVGGIANQQATQLGNRTRYLFDQLNISNTAIGANTTAVAGLTTTVNNILNSWQIHKRHCILDGPIEDNGVPSALKILSAVTRTVGFNLSFRDLIDTEYIWFSFGDGYKQNILGAQDYITRTFSDPAINLTLPSTTGTYLVFAKYVAGVVSLDYCEGLNTGGYIVSALEPTSPPARALWFNPFTQKHKFTINTGANWNDIIAVPFASATVSGGVVTQVFNYDYQSPFYDFNTPPATVIWQASQDMPIGGYLYCNGQAVSRDEYRQLFRKIGTAYGVGDGSTTFNLPDMRGYFMRGFDDGRGIDSGRVFGSTQADDIKNHNHLCTGIQATGATAGNNTFALVDNSTGTPGSDSTQSYGNNLNLSTTETRPKNIALKAWIKY
jgi:microcystin-dependent protein